MLCSFFDRFCPQAGRLSDKGINSESNVRTSKTAGLHRKQNRSLYLEQQSNGTGLYSGQSIDPSFCVVSDNKQQQDRLQTVGLSNGEPLEEK